MASEHPPRRGLGGRRGPRRRRQRRRRAHRRARRRRRRAAGRRRHQGRRGRRLDPVGPGRRRRRRRRTCRATASTRTSPTPSPPVPGCATPPPSPPSSTDGPAAVARLRGARRRVRRDPDRRAGAHPRGRALGVPGGPRRAATRPAPRSSGRSSRPRGRRPAAADRARRRRRAARRPTARVAGVTVLDDAGRPGVLHAPAVLLATGGYGQLFASTTNPATSTGDGVALALRAGATAADLEFVQFHPTVLHVPGGARAPAAGHRGGPRRGRRAARPHRRPVHGRRAPAGRARPAGRRRRGDHPADGADRRRSACGSTPPRSRASPPASRR